MKKLLVSMLAVLTLVACQETQSELAFDAIKGSGVIKGTVLYELTEASAENQAGEIFPAAGVEVVATVQNSAYASGAEGQKIYTATTDAKGEYLFTIPVSSKPIEVVITTQPYQAGPDSAYFTTRTEGDLTLRVASASVVVADNIMLYENLDYQKKVGVVEGTIFYDYGYVKEGDAIAIQHLPAAGVELTTVVNGKKLSTTTDAEGRYSFHVYLENALQATLEITPREWRAQHSFEHDGELVVDSATYVYVRNSKDGAYEGVIDTEEDDRRGKIIANVIAGETTEIQEPILLVTEKDIDKAAATLIGTVLYEAGFVKDGASYEKKNLPAAGAEVVLTIGTKDYVATTNAAGVFKVIIPDYKGQVLVKQVREYRNVYTSPDDNGFRTDSATFSSWRWNVLRDWAISYTVTPGEVTEVEEDDFIVICEPTIDKNITRTSKIRLVGEVFIQGEKDVKETAEDSTWTVIDGKDVRIPKYNGTKYEADNKVPYITKLWITFRGTSTQGEVEEVRYEVQSNASGAWTLDAVLYDHWFENNGTVSYTIDAADALVTNFVHNYFVLETKTEPAKWKQQTITGFHRCHSRSSVTPLTETMLYWDKVKAPALHFTFEPAQPSIILGIGNRELDTVTKEDDTIVWLYKESNPFGWIY